MKLKELYSVLRDQATFRAYKKFEPFQWPESMNIIDYINEFEQLNQKLINYKIDLSFAVCAYKFLKNAKLPKEKRDLAHATIPNWTYESMKKQIKAIYDHCTTSETKVYDISDIKTETENAYYGQRYPGGKGEVGFIEALQKSLILTGIQPAEMEDPPDVIYVSPFFIGQLIAQLNL